jgi:RNA polymerase-associated protein RTF1
MVVEDCKIPMRSTLAAKLVDINSLLNHKFTKEELNEKLRKQGVSDNKMAIWKRLELDKALKDALAAGDEDEVEKIQAEVTQNTGPKLAFGTTLVKARSEQQNQQQRIAEINQRNQKLNTENVRRAQLEEKKANRKAAAAVARGEAVADPFARVKTRAKTHHDVAGNNRLVPPKSNEQEDRSRTSTPMTSSQATGNSDTPKRSQTPSGSQKKPTKGIAVIRHRNLDDENIAALDMDIDIEI